MISRFSRELSTTVESPMFARSSGATATYRFEFCLTAPIHSRPLTSTLKEMGSPASAIASSPFRSCSLSTSSRKSLGLYDTPSTTGSSRSSGRCSPRASRLAQIKSFSPSSRRSARFAVSTRLLVKRLQPRQRCRTMRQRDQVSSGTTQAAHSESRDVASRITEDRVCSCDPTSVAARVSPSRMIQPVEAAVWARVGNKLGTVLATSAPCGHNAKTPRWRRASLGFADFKHHRNVFPIPRLLADVPDSKSGPRKRVWVQVPPSVLG